MTTKIAMITAVILAAGLMVVASYTSSVLATLMGGGHDGGSVSSAGGASTSGSVSTASGADKSDTGSSSTASQDNTAGAGGLDPKCTGSTSNLGACTGP